MPPPPSHCYSLPVVIDFRRRAAAFCQAYAIDADAAAALRRAILPAPRFVAAAMPPFAMPLPLR